VGKVKTPFVDFLIVYDLQDTAARRLAHEHRRLWGRLYTDCYFADQDHVLLVFRQGGELWRGWEEVRRRRILDGVAA
jgi:hypothetical protein